MPLSIQEIIDLRVLAESSEVEFKLAGGKNGKGQLPNDFWSSYSAMANGRGGWVILGVKEENREFIPVGVVDVEKVKTDLFNQLNDRDRISVNVISDNDVQTVELQGCIVLAIHIPPATRKQKPVHLKKSPFNGNTYHRSYEGDRVCTDEQIKLMLAEQLHDSRDNEVLSEHYSFTDDIDLDSLKAYRNVFAAHKPSHPFLEVDLFHFFKKIGGWRKDRETGKEGITVAGILMFGTWDAITATRPNYFVDYQERPEAKTEQRWIDRVFYDGSWSGNLFDFYRTVYKKLTADLKVPFKLEDGQRKADTPVHTALREALINCIVHADFSERVPILVVKRPDLFGFRNPGLMRLPLEDVIKSAANGVTVSDCRNQTLQGMFLLIGLSERAGSGIPKIYSGWNSVNWRIPTLQERIEPAQTILELNTASLIPEETTQQLRLIFGNKVSELNTLELLIVTTTLVDGWINHERACQLTTLHSREVTLVLPRLESRGFLVAHGEQKQKSYTLPGVTLPSPDEVFALASFPNALTSKSSLTYKEESLTHKEESLTHKECRDEVGRFISDDLDKPYIESLELLSSDFKDDLMARSQLARDSKRLSSELFRNIIIDICKDQYLYIGVLGELLGRTNQNIRQNHLKEMVQEGSISMAFPHTPNSPKQGYTTKVQ
ncbi:RNA-binding domain-containing protein [Aliivibrio fischeri]|uniref:RNA-binding domain-containing protein n=1 Tax=Aliivibrio fischeri TaxID=668 RepID=UPI0012D8C08A|nr:RNA-binding domain-containing protein [Aliivibrio fischeri]MUK26580.1 AAA family ATPase [Aliivibrio fischeri]MUK33658.1 AAA family ATPase [Aliivibrio fischeri]